MSLQKKVYFLTQLRKDKKTRLEAGKVLISGTKMVLEEAKRSLPELLIAEENFPLPKDLAYQELLKVSFDTLKNITGLLQPEPLAAVVAMPREHDLSYKNLLLVLDQIADPGNVGTLLRSALGLGFEGAILIKGSADPYNDKALRAAKGATFHLPLVTMEAKEALEFLEEKGFSLCAASMEGPSVSAFSPKARLALILGSESHGVQKVFDKVAEKVHIPILPKIDSLNVATAGAILMFALKGKIDEG